MGVESRGGPRDISQKSSLSIYPEKFQITFFLKSSFIPQNFWWSFTTNLSFLCFLPVSCVFLHAFHSLHNSGPLSRNWAPGLCTPWPPSYWPWTLVQIWKRRGCRFEKFNRRRHSTRLRVSHQCLFNYTEKSLLWKVESVLITYSCIEHHNISCSQPPSQNLVGLQLPNPRIDACVMGNLRCLTAIHRSVSSSVFLMIVHGFISSRIDYCNSFYAGFPKILFSCL